MKKIKANDYLYSKWINLFLLIICFIVYYPILRNSFLTGWDDQWMVFSHYTENGWTIDNLWHIGCVFLVFYYDYYVISVISRFKRSHMQEVVPL